MFYLKCLTQYTYVRISREYIMYSDGFHKSLTSHHRDSAILGALKNYTVTHLCCGRCGGLWSQVELRQRTERILAEDERGQEQEETAGPPLHSEWS